MESLPRDPSPPSRDPRPRGDERSPEPPVLDHRAALRRLRELSTGLNAAATMREIVRLAAEAASGVLGGRGVHVQVWDAAENGVAVEAACGPEMSGALHRQPLSTKDGEIGAIVVDARCPSAGRAERAGLCADELDLLEAIASSVAVAAHHELRRRERDGAQHAAILALARLAEQRDNETGKHLERVASYCELVARGLRDDGLHRDVIDEAFVEDLVRSSVLHDIGKVGVPDSILLKPGKLTEREWEIMKTHAELGALTLAGAIAESGGHGFLAMGRDIAWCHHERWDGQGYPRGLRGIEIPLSARILALADVYDALTTERPYKSAWSHARAVAWLRAHSGTQFDPDVVAAFLAREGRADAIRARLADAAPADVAEAADAVVRHA